MAIPSPQLHTLLVLRKHGHRHRLNPTIQYSVPLASHLLPLHHFLPTQHRSLRTRLAGVNRQVHAVPGDMGRHGARPCQQSLPEHHPHGFRNAGEHVDLGLRASLGRLGQDGDPGVLDSGCCCVGADYSSFTNDAVCYALLSALTYLLTPQRSICRDDVRTLDRINAAQLLPIAATVVAAGIGAKTAVILDDPWIIQNVVFTCYVLWGISLPFAFMVFVLYYHRLVLHKLPSREVIVSAFQPLGPCGYGATM
jgi:voltage-gated anion channel